ncbi:hypothetical protein L7F22_028852 [Adiantum nelumboides]|nr:hypothetical protein [Adiantum nelumboides]
MHENTSISIWAAIFSIKLSTRTWSLVETLRISLIHCCIRLCNNLNLVIGTSTCSSFCFLGCYHFFPTWGRLPQLFHTMSKIAVRIVWTCSRPKLAAELGFEKNATCALAFDCTTAGRRGLHRSRAHFNQFPQKRIATSSTNLLLEKAATIGRPG